MNLSILHPAKHGVSYAAGRDAGYGVAGALRRAGQGQRAQELLQNSLPVDRYGAALGRLVCHAVCGEMDEAAHWGCKVLEQRDPRLFTIIALLRSPSRNVIRSNDSWSSLTSSLRVPLEC